VAAAASASPAPTAKACVMGDMDLLRPLALAEIPCAVVSRPGVPSLYSRYALSRLAWDDYSGDTERLLDALVGFGTAQPEPPVLFYQEDGQILLISRHRERLAKAFRFVVADSDLVEDLLDFARRNDLYLLSDECYDEILFEGIHVSPGALLSHDEFNLGRVICVYTFSKTYAMTGWRIGYLVTGTQLLKTITYVLDASYTNISTVIQRAAAAALTGPQTCVAEMRQTYHRRRDLAVRLLKELGRYVYTPHGAFYLLIDVTSTDGTGRRGRQFALDLLRERNVAAAPGSTFGSVAENHVRISLAASDEEIVHGVREICAFADR